MYFSQAFGLHEHEAGEGGRAQIYQHAGITFTILDLAKLDGHKSERSRFKTYPIGQFHIDIAQLSTEENKLHLFATIDSTRKFAFVQLHAQASQRIAAESDAEAFSCLRHVPTS